jgi:thioredoxin reductase (NADPH)
VTKSDNPYDAIIVGAGPGGIQAAIYLGRYNFNVLILERGVGGRTRHAVHVENYLGFPDASGADILDIGLKQAKHFGVEVREETVEAITKDQLFTLKTAEGEYSSRFVIVSTGVRDNLLQVENLGKHFAKTVYTCVDCDGHRTEGKKLLVIGNSFATVRLAFALKEMYTKDITLLLPIYDPPDDYKEALADEGITLMKGRPKRLIGEEVLEALELEDGSRIECERIMSNFGFKLNDKFLDGLPLKRDAKGFKYEVNTHFESSVDGLYIVGPLNTGNDQIVIAAGEGATAAIDIKKRILEALL